MIFTILNWLFPPIRIIGYLSYSTEEGEEGKEGGEGGKGNTIKILPKLDLDKYSYLDYGRYTSQVHVLDVTNWAKCLNISISE